MLFVRKYSLMREYVYCSIKGLEKYLGIIMLYQHTAYFRDVSTKYANTRLLNNKD